MRSTSIEFLHPGRLVGLSCNRNILEVLDFVAQPERLYAHDSGHVPHTASRRRQGFFCGPLVVSTERRYFGFAGLRP
jgi:hypothetical protein